MYRTKRVYEPAAEADGQRFLVDRLWPRGVRKEALQLTAWLKDAAPSRELREWFSHQPAKWKEFQRRYRRELDEQPEACRRLLEAGKSSDVTLLFSARDLEHNNAVALKAYLEARGKPKPTR